MQQRILKLIDEQLDPEAMLIELENAEDKDLLDIARKIKIKRNELNWFRCKVNELYSSVNGRTSQDGLKGEVQD